MNRGGAGWGYPRPDHWHYHRLGHQATSASQWSHRAKSLAPGSDLQPRGNFLPGSKRSLVSDDACDSPPAKKRSVASEQSFDCFVKPERFKELKKLSDRFGAYYDGRGHGKYATDIKYYTTRSQRQLSDHEQNCLMPCLQEFKPRRHWCWRSLTTITHSFTSAGLFTPRQFTTQAVRNSQTVLLKDLFRVIRYKCNLRPEISGIDTMGIANLLWVMTKLMDDGQTLTPEFTETLTALLPHLIALKDHFNPLDTAILLRSMAKLLDNVHTPTAAVKESVTALLPRVIALKKQFFPQNISNLIWSVAKLLDSGYELTTQFNEVVAALLPQVRALKEQFDPQAVANLLWAMAKLVNNGYQLTTEFNETVVTLLPQVKALEAHFNPQEITNLLSAMAKLVDSGFKLTPELQGTMVTLLPRVHALKADFKPQEVASLLCAMARLANKDRDHAAEFNKSFVALLPSVTALMAHFKFQDIVNLVWAVAKLVESGQELTPEFKQTVAALLPRVNGLKEQYFAKGVANLLWAVAKLLDHGQELTPEFNRSLAALLPHVILLKEQFIAQSVASLMWAMAKLVDNGYERTQVLEESVVALLPVIGTYTNQFIPQHIANLLWAMAKLVDNGQAMTPEFKVVLAVLLPRVNVLKEQFISQNIANLLWAMVKLMASNHGLTPELKAAVAGLLPCVSVLKGQFNSRGTANLFWALGSLGDLISTAVTAAMVESVPGQLEKFLLFTQRELIMSLWGLLVCCARLYLHNNISDQYNTLECLINKLFSHLENAFIDNEQSKSVMALAASWLGRACPVDPHYPTRNSATQSVFHAQLQAALPSLKIEQEKSLHSLPPVDLLLPGPRIAIEIQGPSHYVGRDFQTRNGSTLLKTALLQKAGYDVLEIPVSHLQHHDSVKMYIEQIQRKMIDTSVDDGIHHAGVTGREGEFFSA